MDSGTGVSQALVRAVVSNNLDPIRRGRIRFRAPTVLGPLESEWAEPSGPGGVSPRIGEVVWVSFQDGNATRPVWINAAAGPEGGQGPPGPEGPVGPEGPRGPQGDAGTRFEASFVTPATTWEVNHNLGTKVLAVECFEPDGVHVKHGEIAFPSVNTVTVNWYFAEVGIVRLF